MIVFYFLLVIICIIVVFIFSSIEMDIDNIAIECIQDLLKASELIFSDDYFNIFNYIKVSINIQIKLFSVLPILIFKIDNKRIKRIIKKHSEAKKNIIYLEKIKVYLRKRNNQKQVIQLFKKILVWIKMERSELYLNIGLDNAKATAIATGSINAIISSFLLSALDVNLSLVKSKKRIAKIQNNYEKILYSVQPLYVDTVAFYFSFRTKFKIPTRVFLL